MRKLLMLTAACSLLQAAMVMNVRAGIVKGRVRWRPISVNR